MAAEFDKENIADGLVAPAAGKITAPSPKKKGGMKKSRSMSMGPGALSVPLKEDAGNRRKSAFVPAVKSILSGEDEAKRREARRKSLANRRVSFAPEATLHTWDVIEYMRDATTSSSASSESTRRASSVSQESAPRSPVSAAQSPAANSDAAEPPSTPPEQVEEQQVDSSPANQRDLHQRKYRRRSSGIPPMNFNNPDDAYSSSPYSGSSPTSTVSMSPDVAEEDQEDTAMDLGAGDVTEHSIVSNGSDDTPSSGGRLDGALRQAAVQAGTRGIEIDENGDMSMEIANEEITAAFKPWVQKNKRDSIGGLKLSAMQDQENVNLFSPAFKSKAVAQLSGQVEHGQDEETQDMSMDITRVMGGIIQQEEEQSNALENTTSQRRILKRRRSSNNPVSEINATSQGSPMKRPASRRSSIRRRRSSAAESELGDETMDFTMAAGGIQQIHDQSGARRESIASSLEDVTMDLTMVQGSILETANPQNTDDLNADEDLSMELTATLEKTIRVQASSAGPQSPAKSTRSPRRAQLDAQSSTKSPSGQVKEVEKTSASKSPRKSPRKSLAPALPSANDQKYTPAQSQDSPKLIQLESPNMDPALSEQQSTMHPPSIQVIATPPQQKDAYLLEPTNFTPLKHIIAKQPSLSDSIKLLSTPRKQASISPQKKAATPKKQSTPKKASTPRKTPTPRRSETPRKRVRLDVVPRDEEELAANIDEGSEEVVEEDFERIQLQDFLNMTNIRFMDLTTTKRRHTGHPGAENHFTPDFDDQEESAPSLESNVAAAVGTVPMLTMYQHSCHEMKNYISGGRDDLRILEMEVYESQPPLFREYMSAPPEERSIMDNQFKNMKTNARLQSKGGWYAWRSQLLNDLKNGLLHSAAEFDQDELLLSKQEKAIGSTLPYLSQRHDELEAQSTRLKERAEEMLSSDREELDAVREHLTLAEAEMEEKTQLLERLRKELEEKEGHIEAAEERKNECFEEIKEAERIREEFRGWSSGEVSDIKAKVDALEREYGWSVSAASEGHTLTLAYLSDLELFFHPSSFQSQSESEQPNAPLSLTYIGDHKRPSNPRPRTLTTAKRFFLQLLRAHLHSFAQYQTQISTMLKVISSAWDTALAVSEAVRLLSQSCITDEVILSDERMAVDAILLLPTLQTKVRARFEIAAAANGDAIETNIKIGAKVIYGERYDEPKMGEFLKTFTGESVGQKESMARWADGVEDLRARLIRRGRKG